MNKDKRYKMINLNIIRVKFKEKWDNKTKINGLING